AEDADINPYGLSAKTTRKTLESWCIAAGMLESTVCLRQGHDNLTSMKHYQGLAFSADELRDIEKQLIAWSLMK
ncbi:MAG: site-specific integrase, partial [Bacteroidota bacterium]|nr:site-specific integrase [Bacteroidota bacterium]